MKRLFIFIGLTFAIVCMNVQADEVVAQKVTDLTSLATLAYDVAVDKEVRSRIYNQFVEIKNEVGEDPKAFLPILIDVIVTVTTNKTPEQIQEIFNEKTDAGQRAHYATSATGNAIMTVMAGAAMVKDLPEIAEKLGENIKKVKNINIPFINGWTKESILSLPKGSRPNPSEYLSDEYIVNHLRQFDDGIGRVSRRDNFEKFGTLGGDNSFVLPESELRKIIKETGGNVSEIEKRLGMNPGDLGDSPVFGVFQRESLGEVKIPTGNESGVNNNWIPGGKTSGEVSEGIVNLSGNTSFELIN